jgi:hypothetical protein
LSHSTERPLALAFSIIAAELSRPITDAAGQRCLSTAVLLPGAAAQIENALWVAQFKARH